jgi:hypothetical protein
MTTGRPLVKRLVVPPAILLFSAIPPDHPVALVVVLCVTVLLLLLWVSATGREAWPFSSYPMFSTYRNRNESGYYQFYFVRADGRRVTPPAALADLTEEFDRSYRRLGEASNASVAQELRRALVDRVATVCTRLDPTLAGVMCLEVWERSARLHDNRVPDCLDRCVARFAAPVRLPGRDE